MHFDWLKYKTLYCNNNLFPFFDSVSGKEVGWEAKNNRRSHFPNVEITWSYKLKMFIKFYRITLNLELDCLHLPQCHLYFLSH